MEQIIFATNNKNKVEEVKSIVGSSFNVISMKEAGLDLDIPEPHETLEENALEKSRTVNQLTGQNCFSEDTGLEVEALNGAPGVKSARYAGDEPSTKDNIEKLLKNLEPIHNKKARFRTVISAIVNGEQKTFEGICEGTIIPEQRGTGGFGYDSVFVPTGSHKTFAEMLLEEKNLFSHRKKAILKLASFLSEFWKN
ncbi:MAG: RdgB/HAM1 family non-canonical purine NTP pyrophosphatase [Bacteroidota bacterium]|nr:RdgB/HAM1 family non-canonical purine NTP pyrophosphatase [Bacteroidota bacterium]